MNVRTYLRLLLAGGLLCLLAVGVLSPQTVVQAATITVFSTADGGGTCPGATCTLRQAILGAAPGDTINFDASLNNQTILLTSTQIDIGQNLTITTSNPSGGFFAITVKQTASDKRIFNINSGSAFVAIAGLKLTGVHLTTAGSRGGAIFNGGTLTLDHVEVTGNTAEDSGGGIWNRRTNAFAGNLTLLHSTIDNNTYTFVGGANGAGIFNQGSTFGAPCSVATPCLATLTMVDSTVSNNFGPSGNTGSGEGIFANVANVTIISSTVAFNRLGAGGTNSGNVFWAVATGNSLTFRESIIADSNNAGGASWDIATNGTSVNSQGFNDVQNRNAGNITSGYQGTDLPDGTDPLLGALASNGGPTQTHAIPGISPALDKVPPANCTDQFSNPILVDQRDSDRPAPVSGNCDIGAYEKANITITPTTLPVGVRNNAYPSTTLTGHGGKAPYSFSIGSGALPNGLSLSSAGVISGTPTKIGSFTFGVNATDAYGATIAAPQSFTILVFAEATSTITVDTNTDPGNVNCATTCSLRTALAYASSGDTINFAGGLNGQTITLNNANGTLNIQSNAGAGNPSPLNNLTIQGLGASSLTINGNGNQAVFTVAPGITTTINALKISNGHNAANGGGIVNSGGATLTVNNSTFSGNSTSNSGGGIANSGTLTVSNSTFSGNSAINGGGIVNLGTLTISNSTFSANSVSANGGGVLNAAGSLTISNSTLSANTATSSGGGISNNASSTLNIGSTILAANTAATGPDIFNNGTLNSLGFNLVQTPGGVSFSGPGDQTGVDPLLGPLANNGGSTQTMAVPVGSPAYTKGNCTLAGGVPPAIPVTTDQRGQTRKTSPGCDVGAFEETFMFAPATLPSGVVGNPYPTQTIVASGGAGGYTYVHTTGSLPPGLNLSNGGVLSGTPTSAGTFVFTVAATDSSGIVGSVSYTIVITSPTPTPTPTNTNTPTVTPSNTITATPTNTFTATATNTVTPTPSQTYTPSPTLTPSLTSTPTATYTATATLTATYTPTATATPTSTPTTIPACVKNGSASNPGALPIDTIGLFDPTSAQFFLRNSNSAGAQDFQFQFGPAPSGLTAISGDWINQGKTTIGLFDAGTSTFYLKNHNSAGNADITYQLLPAVNGRIPITGNWTGAGAKTGGEYDRSTGTFYLKNSNTSGTADTIFQYGPGGIDLYPIAGDWFGQGHDTVGLYSMSNACFYLKHDNSAPASALDLEFQFGPGHNLGIPVIGHWMGGTQASIGVYIPANAIFYLKNTNQAGTADNQFQYGPGPNAGWKPIIGHWGAPGTIPVPPTPVPARITGALGFVSNRSGKWHIYRLNGDESHLQSLADIGNNPVQSRPAWSPDGRQVAFVSDKSGNPEIYAMSADGSNVRRLTFTKALNYQPTWSPDGKHIAFVSNRDNTVNLYVMDASGGNVQQLTHGIGVTSEQPAWSPDGKVIVYATGTGTLNLAVMNATGSKTQRLTTNGRQPTWSPDGKQISFVSTRDGNSQIYLMNADGSNIRRLTNDQAEDEMPTWSPDGKQIAFVSTRDGNAQLYVMNADGSNTQRLTHNTTQDQLPVWLSQ